MKCTVQYGLSAEAVRSAVPSRYRSRLPPHLPAGEYTLLLFRSGREDVVLSRTVEQALATLPESAAKPVAVGGCFTEEGLELLRRRGAVILQLAEFYWTDASYLAIHEGHD